MSSFEESNLDEPYESDEGSSDGSDSLAGKETVEDRQLALVKRGHRYVFNYAQGQEYELLQKLESLARDPHCSLEMFDAAVLSHQIGRRLSQQVERMLKR